MRPRQGRQLQLQLLLWPLRRKDKQEQNEEERVEKEEGLLLLIPLAVRASGGIGSPVQGESSSRVCQCATVPPA